MGVAPPPSMSPLLGPYTRMVHSVTAALERRSLATLRGAPVPPPLGRPTVMKPGRRSVRQRRKLSVTLKQPPSIRAAIGPVNGSAAGLKVTPPGLVQRPKYR